MNVLTKIRKKIGGLFMYGLSFFGPPIMTKPAERTFFFGYGSLMYPAGINRRGMRKWYDWSDLKTARVTGFERGFFVKPDIVRFYGVEKKEESTINGVVFEVLDDHDYTYLMISEGAHDHMGDKRVYELLEVTDKISNVNLPSDARVFMVIPTAFDKEGYIAVEYLKRIWDAIQHWGPKFVEEFLATGGRKYDRTVIEEMLAITRKRYGTRKVTKLPSRRKPLSGKSNSSNGAVSAGKGTVRRKVKD